MERLIRSTAAALVIFAAVFAFIVGQRVDQITIALLGGVMIGLLVTLPVLAVLVFAWLRGVGRDSDAIPSRQHYYAPLPQQPPMVWSQAPTARQVVESPYLMDGAGSSVIPQAFQLPPQRKFYVIGEDGVVADAS